MYEVLFGIGIIIFLAVIIYPQQPTAALFWIGGITTGIIGSFCTYTIKIPFTLCFVLLMILGTLFIFMVQQ
ncbi:MAG: hypothetical protein QXL17_01490 [Candidatus Thermoplasmatota archaeon]